MTAILEQRVTRAAGWSRRTGAFAAVLFVVAGLSHRYGFLESPPFITVLAIVAVLAVAALLFAAYAFARLWNHGDLGGRDMAVGTMLGVIVLAPFLLAAYLAFTRPMLHDVSTDLDDPPALARAAQMRGPQMMPVLPIGPAEAKLQAEAYPAVTGRRYDLSFEQTLDQVNAVLGRRGWLVYPTRGGVSDAEVTIEATAHTLVLAFPIDVAIRVTDETTSSYVDMRSASRFGRHDLGDNAARIAAFLAELDVEVAGQAVPTQQE